MEAKTKTKQTQKKGAGKPLKFYVVENFPLIVNRLLFALSDSILAEVLDFSLRSHQSEFMIDSRTINGLIDF